MGRPRKLSKWQVEIALATTHGNISAAARLLKSTRNTVKAVMRFWGHGEHDYAHPEHFDRDYERFKPPIESAIAKNEQGGLGPKLLTAEAAAPAQAAIPPAPKPAPEPAAPRDACSICGKVFEPGKRKVHGANCTEWPRFRGGGVAV